jgi:S-adenosylmethionine:tRNA ribosyltransferase-isomerase
VNNQHIHTNIQEISMAEFDYDLPQEQIAMHPLENRHDSRLLLYNNDLISEDTYKNLHKYLPSNAHLIFNNSKVIAARIIFKKTTGALIEIFLLEPAKGQLHSEALCQKTSSTWQCLVGGVKKWKNGEILKSELSGDKNIPLKATLLGKYQEYCEVQFTWDDDDVIFSEIVSAAGKIPLPPYIKRNSTSQDADRYQTVYAKTEGSVAAPTAGLHFTEETIEGLHQKGIEHSFVTLHVGAGTFKPVSAETIADHEMHQEYFEIEKKTIEILADNTQMIVAVGTTSLRTIESLYWIGVKMLTQKKEATKSLAQWENLGLQQYPAISTQDAFNALLTMMNKNNISVFVGITGICIVPGYQFKVAKALITNFHQPQSTLLLLIAAILGNKWKTIYKHAIENNFRFLSYGDGSLLFMQSK